MRTTSYRHVHACVDLCWVLRVDECLIQFCNGCEWNGVKQILHTCFGIHVRPGEDQDEKSVADQRTNPHFTTFITLLTPKRCSWPNNFYKRWVGPCLSTYHEKTWCDIACGGGCILPWVVALCWYETPATRIASANRHGTLSAPRQKQWRLWMLWMLGVDDDGEVVY